MRNENQETIADIVAEVRARANAWPDPSLVQYDERLADRIEAAAKREREAGAEAAQVCGEIGEMIGREAIREKSSRVGNSAKMREALSDACYAMFNFLKTQNGGYEEMAKALDKAKAALAATPRNCDIGTALEQVSRHRIWCKCGGACAVSCKMCFAKWSQMPYEGGGAK